MSKSVLFYWSKGARTRLRLLHAIRRAEQENRPCYITALAQQLGLSHVAVKKHVGLMVSHGFVVEQNPGGKPVFLRVSRAGRAVLEEVMKRP